MTSPVNDSVSPVPFVRYVGTAPLGSQLFYQFEDDAEPFPIYVIDADGWSFDTFPNSDIYPLTRTVTFTGTDPSGPPFIPVSVTVTIPALLPAPVITSPAPGSTTTGTEAVIAGTGVAGSYVALTVYQGSSYSSPEPVLVAADNTWSYRMPAVGGGAFNVSAIHAYPDPNSSYRPGFGLAGRMPAQVAFAVIDPTPPSTGTGGDELAATGADARPVIADAGLIALGTMLIVASRRRRLVSTD